MKRPDKEISELNGTLNRTVLDYISWLEGFEQGVRDAAEWMTRMARAKHPPGKAKAPVHPQLNCGNCKYSQKIPAPDDRENRTHIVCMHENVAAELPTLIAQHRAFGCGSEATLWEAKEEAKK